jgi:hypothetical protein
MHHNAIIVCQIVASFIGNDFRTNAPTYRYEPPKCYSEADVVPEELLADDETSRSLAAKIDDLVKKMEAP